MNFVFDIETTGLRMQDGFRCMGHALCDEAQPVKDPFVETVLGDAIEKIVGAINHGHTIVGHNIVCYDLPKLVFDEYQNYKTRTLLDALQIAEIRDTLYESRQLVPDRTAHTMESWSIFLAHEYDCKAKVVVPDFQTASLVLLMERVLEDVRAEAALADYLDRTFGVEECLQSYKFEREWFKVCVELVSTGMPLDMGEMSRIAEELQEMQFIPQYFVDRNFPGVNMRSGKQVDDALKKIYGKGLPVNPKTSKPTMSKKKRDQIVAWFPLMRYHYKVKDTSHALEFVKEPESSNIKYLGQHVARGIENRNMVYPSLSYLGTRTGRMQYNNPPIQQVPKKVRGCIVAPEGWLMVGMDVVALEMACLGHLMHKVMDDEMIKKQVESGQSAKTLTLEAFRPCFANVKTYGGETLEDVAKELNYSLIYGIGHSTVAYRLNMPSQTTAQLNESVALVKECVAKRFPALEQLNRVVQDDMDGDVVKGYYGTPVITETWKALNAFMQNFGADYARRIMWVWHTELKRVFGNENVRASIYNMDELQCLVRGHTAKEVKSACDEVSKGLRQKFESHGWEWITGIDYAVGKSWDQTH